MTPEIHCWRQNKILSVTNLSVQWGISQLELVSLACEAVCTETKSFIGASSSDSTVISVNWPDYSKKSLCGEYCTSVCM